MIKLKRHVVENLFLYIIFLLSFLSYEYRIYQNFYNFILLVILILGLVVFFISITKKEVFQKYIKNIRNNVLVSLLAFMLMFSILMTSNKQGFVDGYSLIRVILVIISLYVFYLFLPLLFIRNIRQNLRYLSLLIAFFSLVAIVIEIKGSFFHYTYVDLRNASVFFDPNYFGTLCAIGIVLTLSDKGKYKYLSLVNILALYFSGSRGAVISLILAFILSYFYQKRINIKTVLILVILALCFLGLIKFLIHDGFFREHNILSGRDYLWELSFELIKEEPLWGYGAGSVVGYLLEKEGTVNRSSHNSYIDFILSYGLFSFVLYILIILNAFYKGIKNYVPSEIIKCVILILINANSISINLGGLGLLSLIFTVLLGACVSYQINNFGDIYYKQMG